MSDARVSASAIASLISDAMKAVGVPPGDAAKVAELMLEADLTGADAHVCFGCRNTSGALGGGVDPKPNITVEKTAPATAMVDGDNSYGPSGDAARG